jgi:hypothetical protein
MEDPAVKIDKSLAEILRFPEEPSVKFLKDYKITRKNVTSTEYQFIFENKPILLEDIYYNILNLSVFNKIFKSEDYDGKITLKDDGIIFSFKIEDLSNSKYGKYLYKNIHEIRYIIGLHYKYTDYTAYSKSYKIMTSETSKDFKPIIMEKLREKIVYSLNELHKVFKRQSKVLWNNLIELFYFDVSNLNINIQDYTIDKKSVLKNIKKYETLEIFEDMVMKSNKLEDIHCEISGNKHVFIINKTINVLNKIAKIESIKCFLHLIEELEDFEDFGQKTVNLLTEIGLPF